MPLSRSVGDLLAAVASTVSAAADTGISAVGELGRFEAGERSGVEVQLSAAVAAESGVTTGGVSVAAGSAARRPLPLSQQRLYSSAASASGRPVDGSSAAAERTPRADPGVLVPAHVVLVPGSSAAAVSSSGSPSPHAWPMGSAGHNAGSGAGLKVPFADFEPGVETSSVSQQQQRQQLRDLRAQARLHRAVAATLSRWRAELLALAALTGALFVLKSVLFLWRPLLHAKIDGAAGVVAYPFGFYTVPEVLPALLVGSMVSGLPLHAPFVAAYRAAAAVLRALLASTVCYCCRGCMRRSWEEEEAEAEDAEEVAEEQQQQQFGQGGCCARACRWLPPRTRARCSAWCLCRGGGAAGRRQRGYSRLPLAEGAAANPLPPAQVACKPGSKGATHASGARTARAAALLDPAVLALLAALPTGSGVTGAGAGDVDEAVAAAACRAFVEGLAALQRLPLPVPTVGRAGQGVLQGVAALEAGLADVGQVPAAAIGITASFSRDC
jgi:hypothetical protein